MKAQCTILLSDNNEILVRAQFKGRVYERTIDLDPIVARLKDIVRRYHQEYLHGDLSDDTVSGLQDWYTDAAHSATRIACGYAIREIRTDIGLDLDGLGKTFENALGIADKNKGLIAAAATVYGGPAAGKAVSQGFEAYETLKGAAKGDPNAKQAIQDVKDAAHAGDPNAQDALAVIIKLLTAMEQKQMSAQGTKISGYDILSAPHSIYVGDNVNVSVPSGGSSGGDPSGGGASDSPDVRTAQNKGKGPSRQYWDPKAKKWKHGQWTRIQVHPTAQWLKKQDDIAQAKQDAADQAAQDAQDAQDAADLAAAQHQAEMDAAYQNAFMQQQQQAQMMQWQAQQGQWQEPYDLGDDISGFWQVATQLDESDYTYDEMYDEADYHDAYTLTGGWGYNRPYRSTADAIVQIDRSPGLGLGLRELYNLGMGRAKTTKEAILLSASPTASKIYQKAKQLGADHPEAMNIVKQGMAYLQKAL